MRSRLQKINPDTSNPSERRKLTDTEIIHTWIENGESILLRGPSGIGKTQRIRDLYPDVIELKLTNNMFPEKVVGSTNLQTGEEIPPNYAKQIILKSASDEDKKEIEEDIQKIYDIADKIYEKSQTTDKKIVVLLDELLNVKPHIQSLVYTLVLNRFVESGKGVKLPKNVVIVATGNPKKFSSASEDLAKPLEKRFDHILDMKPRVGEWLFEYAVPKKIHPAVIGFILSQYEKSGCSEDIEDIEYFYEEDLVEDENLEDRKNDPRSWEAISKIVQNYEENLVDSKYTRMDVEDIFRRSVSSKLSPFWAEKFFEFYEILTLTPEEVSNGLDKDGGYSEEDLPIDDDEKYIYTLELLVADESQVGACRKFISDYCSDECLKVFDKYWCGNDKQRKALVGNLKANNSVPKRNSTNFSQFAGDGLNAFSNLGQDYKKTLNLRGDEEHDEHQI